MLRKGAMTDLADPERALALAYAPANRRPALELLWRLDERFGDALAAGREPMIRAIRLAWWRESLEALDTGAPPAEPLLAEIAATLLPLGISGAELASIEEGWAAIVDTPGEEDIAAHGRCRGGRLFGIASRLLAGREAPDAVAAGEGWALADLAAILDDRAARAAARALGRVRLRPLAGRVWPRCLRPLGVLAVLAARDLGAEGERSRRGSPGRVMRALWMGISGR